MKRQEALVYLILALIIANAAYYGFTHYEGPSVYGDDPNYLYLASSLLKGTYIMNPGYIFSLRVMQFAPIAMFYAILGVHTYSASAWDIFSYLGTIIVVFLFGRFFYNDKAGLFAAFTISIFPLLTKFAVTTGEDPPLMFVCSLAILMLLYGRSSHKPKYYMASGLLLVAAWLISYEAGVILAFILVLSIYETAKRFLHHRKHFRNMLISGFCSLKEDIAKSRYMDIYRKARHLYALIGKQASVFLVLGVIIGFMLTFIFSAQYSNSGPYVTITRNLNFYSKIGSSVNGLPTIPTSNVNTATLNATLKTLGFYPNDMFPYHIFALLGLLLGGHMNFGQFLNTININIFGIGTLTEFGVSFYIVVLAIIVLLIARERRALFVGLWFAFMFLFLEFGPMSAGISLDPLKINYVLAYRLGRFLIITIPAASVLVGMAFARLTEFKKLYFMIPSILLVICLLAIMYFNNTATSTFWYYWQYYPESISIQAGRFIRYDSNATASTLVYTEAFFNNAVVPYTGSNMPEYIGDPSTSNLVFEINNTTSCSTFDNHSYVIWHGPPHCSNWINVFNVSTPKGIPEYFIEYETPMLPYVPTNVYYVK
jgi:hypothetical protein